MDEENNISFEISYINDKSYKIKSFEDLENFTSRNMKSKNKFVLDFNKSENNKAICEAFIYFSDNKGIKECLENFTKNYINYDIGEGDDEIRKKNINNSFEKLLKDNGLETQEIDLFSENKEQVIEELKKIRISSLEPKDTEKENKIKELDRIQNCFTNFEEKFDEFSKENSNKNKGLLQKYSKKLEEDVNNKDIFDNIGNPFDNNIPEILTDSKLKENVTQEEFETYSGEKKYSDISNTLGERFGTVISYTEYMLNMAYEKTVSEIFNRAKEYITNGENITIEEAVEKSIKELEKEAIIKECAKSGDLEEIKEKYSLELGEDEEKEILNKVNEIREKENKKTEQEKRKELKEKEKFYIDRIKELYKVSTNREVDYEKLESTKLRETEQKLEGIEELNKKIEKFYRRREGEIEEKKKNKIKEITEEKKKELKKEDLTEKELEYVDKEAEERAKEELYDEIVKNMENKRKKEEEFVKNEIKKSRENEDGKIYKKIKELKEERKQQEEEAKRENKKFLEKYFDSYVENEIKKIEKEIREESYKKIQSKKKETDNEKEEREFVENIDKLNEETKGFGWEGKILSDKYGVAVAENLKKLEEIQEQLGEEKEKKLDAKVENLKYELFKFGNKVENWRDMKNKLMEVRRERIATTKIRCINERGDLIKLMKDVEGREPKELTNEEKNKIVENLKSRKTKVGAYKYCIMPFLDNINIDGMNKMNNPLVNLFRDVRDKKEIDTGKSGRELEDFLKKLPQENLEKLNNILSIKGTKEQLDEISKDSGIKLGTLICLKVKDKCKVNCPTH